MYTIQCALRITKQLQETGVLLETVHDDLLGYYVKLCCRRQSLYPYDSHGNTLLETVFEQDIVRSMKTVISLHGVSTVKKIYM